ncbi:MAG: BNR-4 repeat-containing protein [Candidatus Eisenbacteria bacterium]|nr:BNR-4 repeat-containing protein [Candidatus Eisenbacteria bacterium]
MDVPVRLDLDASIVDWSQGGGDLRFVLVDPETNELRLLDHWLYTDRVTDGAWFACCAFNDFEQYHTPAATYYTCLRPNAIHFQQSHDRTYFVYGEFSRDPAIRYYDHTTKELSDARIPGRTQIPQDAHGNPSLLIDETGLLYVFYGCHGHSIQMRRSLAPESIEEWSTQRSIRVEASYPQPYMLEPGKILVSFRRSGERGASPWSYVTSTDRGETWTSARDIVQEPDTAIYGLTALGRASSDDGSHHAADASRSFHLALTPFHNATRLYTNVYYTRSDDGLTTFLTRDAASPPPLGLGNLETVFESHELSSHVNDLILDDEDRPYILFNVGPWNQSGAPGPGDWRFARRDAGGWSVSQVAPCDHLFDRGCLTLTEDGTFHAYLPVSFDDTDGGEMHEYVSSDRGETWLLAEEITKNSALSHNYAVHVENANPELRVLWSYGSTESVGDEVSDLTSEVILYGDDGRLGSLEGSGRAHAFVRVPTLREPSQLQVYYGNLEAKDVGSMERTLSLAYPNRPDGTPDASLLLDYRMEGPTPGVHDSSPYGNDAQFVNGEGTFHLDGSYFGRRYDVAAPGTALELSPTTYAEIPAVRGPEELSGLTVEVWFKVRSAFSSNALVRLGGDAPLVQLQVYFGRPAFTVRTADSRGGVFDGPHIVPNKWQHLAATYDGAKLEVYLNGIKSSTVVEQSGSLPWAGQPLSLGWSPPAFLNGRTDDVRVYSRALPASEILAHYEKSADVRIHVDAGPPSSAPLGAPISSIDATPNPFRAGTRIDFTLDEPAVADVHVYDVGGRRVRTLAQAAEFSAGTHDVWWDGVTDKGLTAPAGVYFVRFESGGRVAEGHVVRIR